MIEVHKMFVPKTAHFYTLGTVSPAVERFWFVCHGYGQLAQYFLRRFDVLHDQRTLIVAPEGFSRFYTEGFNGPVGASWMTREDRLDEIHDFSEFLQMLYDQFVPQLSPQVSITLFGFSQGCATICRWALARHPHFHRMLLYAGSLPTDLDFLSEKTYLSSRELTWIYGHSDQYITPDRVSAQLDFAKAQQLDLHVLTFDGGHEVRRDVLQQLAG
jgi:predicted esterase